MSPAILSLLVLVLVGYAAVAVLDRRAALAMFVALLPTYVLRFALPLPGLRLPTTFLEMLFGILFVVWFFAEGRESKVWSEQRRWYPALALLFLGATIGVLISPNTLAALGVWRAYFVEPILFFFLFVDLVRDPRARNMVIAALGLSLTAVSIVAFYQKFTGDGIPNPVWQPADVRRATSVYGYPNAIGLFGAPIVVLLLGRAMSLFEKKSPRTAMQGALAVVAAVFGAFGILFAVSEGALIGLAAGAALLGIFLKKTRKLALAAIIAGCIAFVTVPPLMNYATGIIGLQDASSSVRVIVWDASWKMLKDHAVFGAGLAGYQTVLVPYHTQHHIEIFLYPHTFAMNFLSETGLIGLVGVLWLLWLFFRDGLAIHRLRPDDWFHLTLIAAMGAFLVHGLVDVPYFKNDLAFLFMLMLGLMAGLRKK